MKYHEMGSNKPLTVSNHGRITIPALYRRKLKLKDGRQVIMVEDEGTLKIIPILTTEEIRARSCSAEEMERIYDETTREDLELENS